MGISAIGIGGGQLVTKEAVELLMNDAETDGIIMIGEIGGQLEADAAYWIKNGTKTGSWFYSWSNSSREELWGMQVQ